MKWRSVLYCEIPGIGFFIVRNYELITDFPLTVEGMFLLVNIPPQPWIQFSSGPIKNN
jgi:hypothetical protein